MIAYFEFSRHRIETRSFLRGEQGLVSVLAATAMGACVASLFGPMPRRAEIVFNLAFLDSQSAAALGHAR